MKKITYVQAKEIRERFKKGELTSKLASEYKLSRGHIYRIIHKESWK